MRDRAMRGTFSSIRAPVNRARSNGTSPARGPRHWYGELPQDYAEAIAIACFRGRRRHR